jgi:site-specific DNA recombinase
MERPALRRLMADIAAGRVDVVVVYKVDRLTRSLRDFARIVDTLDAAGASFVSVTQAFNTTSSMGRLTLNMLLSFAQFEREVTGERIRDKIEASKRKGLWMGGNLALGYDPNGRTLVVNETEAALVRHVFRRYIELGSVDALRDELQTQGLRSKRWTSRRGSVRGGEAFSRGALFYLLSNRLYLGQVSHKGAFYPGLHPASSTRAPSLKRRLSSLRTPVRNGERVPAFSPSHRRRR